MHHLLRRCFWLSVTAVQLRACVSAGSSLLNQLRGKRAASIVAVAVLCCAALRRVRAVVQRGSIIGRWASEVGSSRRRRPPGAKICRCRCQSSPVQCGATDGGYRAQWCRWWWLSAPSFSCLKPVGGRRRTVHQWRRTSDLDGSPIQWQWVSRGLPAGTSRPFGSELLLDWSGGPASCVQRAGPDVTRLAAAGRSTGDDADCRGAGNYTLLLPYSRA